MGLKKWIAKKGAVGGTARWAAKLYKVYKEEYPEKNDKDIYALMIRTRFKGRELKRAEDFFFSQEEYDVGLRSLVTTILHIEANFFENSFKNQMLFIDVIEEELQKKGIREQIIMGE